MPGHGLVMAIVSGSDTFCRPTSVTNPGPERVRRNLATPSPVSMVPAALAQAAKTSCSVTNAAASVLADTAPSFLTKRALLTVRT